MTIRMFLTHTSGTAGDLSLDGPWGLDPADKAEGIRRALAEWVVFGPGKLFHYSTVKACGPRQIRGIEATLGLDAPWGSGR